MLVPLNHRVASSEDVDVLQLLPVVVWDAAVVGALVENVLPGLPRHLSHQGAAAAKATLWRDFCKLEKREAWCYWGPKTEEEISGGAIGGHVSGGLMETYNWGEYFVKQSYHLRYWPHV